MLIMYQFDHYYTIIAQRYYQGSAESIRFVLLVCLPMLDFHIPFITMHFRGYTPQEKYQSFGKTSISLLV